MVKDVMEITDEVIRSIVDNNPNLENEYDEYLFLKDNLEDKELEFNKRLFWLYRYFDPGLKMSKYGIYLTFCSIIFSILIISTFIIGESTLLRLISLIFLFSCLEYIFATFTLADKKIFQSVRHESHADTSFLHGIIFVLLYLYFDENFQFIAIKALIILLILTCISLLWHSRRYIRISDYFFLSNLFDKMKKKVRKTDFKNK